MGGEAEGRVFTEARGDILMIAIDRPAKLNGFTPDMLGQLAETYTALNDPRWRCGVLHAIGDNFTAGLDLPTMAPLMQRGDSAVPPGLVDPFDLRPPWREAPLVVAVKGWCFTLGIEAMLAADVVVAADNTQFSQLEVGRAVMATGGATLRMVQRAGWGNAMQRLLTGDRFDAETALRLGFVQEVVPAGTELDRAIAIAEEIAAQAPLAVRETIRSARKALREGWPAAVAEFRDINQRLSRTEDAAEGVAAFKEKRPPRFQGK